MLRTMTRRSFFPSALHTRTRTRTRVLTRIRIRIRIPTRIRTRIRIPVLLIIPPAPRTVSRSTITAAADAAERG